MRHGDDVLRALFLSSFMDSSCRVRNKIMHVLSWWTVSTCTRVFFWYLFPWLLRNSGNKHQNNPFMSAETVRHSSTYIILYVCHLIKKAWISSFLSPGLLWRKSPSVKLRLGCTNISCTGAVIRPGIHCYRFYPRFAMDPAPLFISCSHHQGIHLSLYHDALC